MTGNRSSLCVMNVSFLKSALKLLYKEDKMIFSSFFLLDVTHWGVRIGLLKQTQIWFFVEVDVSVSKWEKPSSRWYYADYWALGFEVVYGSKGHTDLRSRKYVSLIWPLSYGLLAGSWRLSFTLCSLLRAWGSGCVRIHL